MEQQRLHQEERVRRALERAKADPKKKVPYCHLLNCCIIYYGLYIYIFSYSSIRRGDRPSLAECYLDNNKKKGSFSYSC